MVQILGSDAHEKSRWRPTVFQFNGLPLDKNIIRCSPFTGKHSSSTCDIFINCWQSDTSLCLHSAKVIYTTRPIVPQVGHLTVLLNCKNPINGHKTFYSKGFNGCLGKQNRVFPQQFTMMTLEVEKKAMHYQADTITTPTYLNEALKSLKLCAEITFI